MERASVRDLHIRTSELVRAAAEGAVIVSERRGEPVAEWRPISKDHAKMRRKILAEMRRLFKKMPLLDGDTGRWLEENRSRVFGFGLHCQVLPKRGGLGF